MLRRLPRPRPAAPLALVLGLDFSRDLLLVGPWPAGWDVSQQPFREALGGVLAFEAFVQAVNIHGYTCVLRNDAAAAIACFRKGSTRSPVMQRCALRLDRAAAAANVDILPLHVPGLTLIAEGIDGASRAGDDLGATANVQSILGPAVSDELWRLAQAAVDAAGLAHITVDAFASESNARDPRFWSRFPEPGSEAIDALCVPDWAQSICPTCGEAHRKVLFVHPPSALVRATLEKAMADRALCALVAVAVSPHRVGASPSQAGPCSADYPRPRPTAPLALVLGLGFSRRPPPSSPLLPSPRKGLGSRRAKLGHAPPTTPVLAPPHRWRSSSGWASRADHRRRLPLPPSPRTGLGSRRAKLGHAPPTTPAKESYVINEI